MAVLAGIATGAVLSVGTDMVLRALGIFPSLREVMANSLLLLATIYRCIYGVLGSYVTARLAPSRPMMYALVLGCLGCAVSILGAVMTWNRGPAFGPHWYPIALIVTALPCASAGGKTREMQLLGQREQ